MQLINYGTNRWALKSELGYSRRWCHWILDAYEGVWFFTTKPEFFSNNEFSPGINTQSQNPTGSFVGHLSNDFRPRLWVSLDGNHWFGGTTSLNGVPLGYYAYAGISLHGIRIRLTVLLKLAASPTTTTVWAPTKFGCSNHCVGATRKLLGSNDGEPCPVKS